MIGYTDIEQEIEFWKDHVSFFEDAELINEVSYLTFGAARLVSILDDFYRDFNTVLSADDREFIEWFYVLNSLDSFVEDF